MILLRFMTSLLALIGALAAAAAAVATVIMVRRVRKRTVVNSTEPTTNAIPVRPCVSDDLY